MILHVKGKIVMERTACNKCSSELYFNQHDETARCKECGAVYQLAENQIDGEQISQTYEFMEFRCIYTSYSLPQCNNVCLAPEMYCKKHLEDCDFKSAHDAINYAKDRLQVAEQTLERMEESKKIWLIQEVSGINEQDCSVRKDEDGQN